MPESIFNGCPTFNLLSFTASLVPAVLRCRPRFLQLWSWAFTSCLGPEGPGMEKDTSLYKVEQAGAQLPAAVWLPEFPCVLCVHYNQHKPTEIYTSQKAKLSPGVFWRTVWGAGVTWLLLTAICTEDWSICPGTVPESEHRVTSTSSHRELHRPANPLWLPRTSAQPRQPKPDSLSSGCWNRIGSKGINISLWTSWRTKFLEQFPQT